MSGYVYVASPYSHPDVSVRWWRYQRACEAAAKLMKAGMRVFAPIPHSHAIARFLDDRLVTDFDFWMAQDLPILRGASRLIVLRLEGWDQSRGVAEELRVAGEMGIPTEYIDA